MDKLKTEAAKSMMTWRAGTHIHDNLMQPRLFIPAVQLENRLRHLFHVLGSIALWSVPATLVALRGMCAENRRQLQQTDITLRRTSDLSATTTFLSSYYFIIVCCVSLCFFVERNREFFRFNFSLTDTRQVRKRKYGLERCLVCRLDSTGAIWSDRAKLTDHGGGLGWGSCSRLGAPCELLCLHQPA